MSQWTNWAGTASVRPRRVHRPTDTAELCAIVAETAERGGRIRPLGSGHSFSPIAAADDDTDVIDLSAFTGIVSADAGNGLVTVRSGTTLRELNTLLAALDLAMTNLGDIDAQIDRRCDLHGTHGTGARFGGLATQVGGAGAGHGRRVRPHLLTHRTSGAVRRRQGRTRRARGHQRRHAALRTRIPPGGRRRPEPLDACSTDFDALADSTDHFEFYWFPYIATHWSNGTPGSPSARRAPAVRRAPIPRLQADGERGFRRPVSTGRAVPRLAPALARWRRRRCRTRAYSDASYRVFITQRLVRFVETEYAVPRESVRRRPRRTPRARPRLRHPVAFPVEVRVAAADDIWLSTAYGRDTGLRRRAPVRRHAVRGVLRRGRADRRVGRRTSALGQDAPARRGRLRSCTRGSTTSDGCGPHWTPAACSRTPTSTASSENHPNKTTVRASSDPLFDPDETSG